MKMKLGVLIALIIFIIVLIGIIIIVPTLIIINNKKVKTEIKNEVANENVIENNVNNNENNNNDDVNKRRADLNFDFLKLENNSKNLIYSPLSIKYALKMLNEGAQGNTKEQIETVLNNVNLTKYKNIEKVLSLANCIYIRDNYAEFINENYKNTLKNKYDAEINYDEFKNSTNVNNWIENKTLGIIKNMLDDDMFNDKDLKMLIINALAIDMEWEEKFSEDNTRGREFTLENGNEVIATTMNKKASSDNIKYYIDDKVTTLTMNLKKYDDTQLEFMAIMPNNEKLSDFVKDISKEKIDDIYKEQKTAASTNAGLNIFVPKFSYEYDLQFEQDLKALGIRDAFDPNLANFLKMTNSEDERLYVGKALHKANIDFTEKGVKAAAVTVFAMLKATAMIQEEKPIEVKIDKPFMYVIKDKNTNEIWFTGTVYEPNLWENDKDDYTVRF